MVKAAHLLRAEDLSISPGHAIEAARLAKRSLPCAGIRCLAWPNSKKPCKRSSALGRTPPCGSSASGCSSVSAWGRCCVRTRYAAPARPERRPKRLRLQPSAAPELLDLDLRKPLQRERSQLLHRLNLLGIPWGRQHAARGAKGTFHELWQIEWQPEFSVRLIEASLWGNTVREAATPPPGRRSRPRRRTARPHPPGRKRAPGRTARKHPPLMARIQALTAASSDLLHLMDALPPLVSVIRYGSVRQTETSLVRRIVEELLLRVCIGLPPAAPLWRKKPRRKCPSTSAKSTAACLFCSIP